MYYSGVLLWRVPADTVRHGELPGRRLSDTQRAASGSLNKAILRGCRAPELGPAQIIPNWSPWPAQQKTEGIALLLIILGLEKIHAHFALLVRELPQVVDNCHVLTVQAHPEVKYDEENSEKHPQDNVELLPSLGAHLLHASKVCEGIRRFEFAMCAQRLALDFL